MWFQHYLQFSKLLYQELIENLGAPLFLCYKSLLDLFKYIKWLKIREKGIVS